jgi:PhoPQ-activated pathogenicity-related protein
MLRIRGLLVLLVGGLAGFAPAGARADLPEYVKRPESVYAWRLKEKISQPDGTIYDMELVSQVWQGITWKHQLQVYQPKDTAPQATMLLWNTGGTANKRNMTLGMELAKRTQAPCAFLYGIPNQPLFGDKKEDALIALTFVKYLTTKDENWPLLFPMVKSVVKAMDALEEFSGKEWKAPVKQFIISGASKRGWTTWLTATVDKRVKAIAPLVIDTLNMKAQMPHQLEAFGTYSEEIGDYTQNGLTALPDTPAANRLLKMVDPYSYREKLKLPKMIINGNNDDYWTVDALNLYWDGLEGPKWLLYVANAGHNLQQKDENSKPDSSRVLNGLSVFVRAQMTDQALPQLKWKHDDQNGRLRLTVDGSPAPSGARLWVARAPTQDFRKAQWTSQPATLDGSQVLGEVDRPAEGFVAFYAELDYQLEKLPYHLSTQLRVAGKAKP